MAVYKIALALTAFAVLTNAQRPFYAGLRPIGYPALATESISNRFGETADVPIEVRGDGNLINRLDQLPAANQPFWYLNWRFYDAQRKNPQTYPQRPSSFAGN
ncbi:jg2620 [Pararge aegeria aegeria]|uniref:Jg2620 protein n=1 Tax=Pararge aegeria aegeria TaxID=348720 RepID=A0A8S4R1H6_9NEOP|nr:jg2620 [Pararge aegeria aegeria]